MTPFRSQAEELGQLVLPKLGADDAKPAGVVRLSGAQVVLLGDVVELQPALLAGDDALGPEDLAAAALVQGGEDGLQLLPGEALGGLPAPTGEHLVGVVVMVVVVMTAAGTLRAVAVLVVMVMVVI